ncbi:hypothetical protein ETAA8_59620 [Anatilimnocola aggregata]|uniref:Activator of Hsp90 ATPase homologue 1/2-like C-terminal domain-containing protein n=1 Tax=Anatilimnocola aggregata TaxID=2528021 RepID=A0A517YKS7_9BACT|nr:SRPBCC family protein [Anatilimnocola aggregata]QDU30813.1 hypothetical protein ETAA8_59620 [Anatilimnocola aggregata]
MDQEFPVRASAMHQFAAPAERVYDAWLKPSKLAQWMFGPNIRDEQIISLDLDPQVGGQFKFVVLRQGAEVAHVGEYLELVRPTRLAFTWATVDTLPDVSRVEIEIVPQGEDCHLTLQHQMQPKWAAFAQKAHAGWTQMLVKLAEVV